MKICWKNLEDLTYLSERDVWRTSKYKYFKHVDSCTFCGEPFLERTDKNPETFQYCSRKCQISCPKQREKQGKSLSNAWADSEKRKNLMPNLVKAIKLSQEKRHKEIALLSKDTKICSICGEERPLNAFTKDERLITRLASACKYCKRSQYTKWTGCDGVRQMRNEYRRNKEISDPKFKLRMRISTAIYQSIVGDKGGRSWEELTGYTLADLKRHLEKQFTDGMTWNNYGKWHLEHKIPISAFNFTKPEHIDFSRCWSLKNLQPMWALENISKGAKLDKPFQPSLLLEAA